MKFEVGEIAIIWLPGHPSHLEEVQIAGPLEFGKIFNLVTETYSTEWFHPITRRSSPGPYVAPLRVLRKRPQPPDWNKIATPTVCAPETETVT
jgi:hypothetical protein